ncbi:MscL family protein [Natronoglycomyces albus]|uniref:MscL family protein n=1 Tax=Natronoglycomyces albus TaxID=2811108 RepID=A0A895XF89_9ACTN|nr:MscL family protein [Natronoglycomyces albus]QSB04511.1 MscL family protein [Natronoglycomyces albus]
MLKGFKEFLLRGNVIELAVAVVMGSALTALVATFGTAFLEPLIVLVTGGDEVGGEFAINGVVFPYAVFINGLLVFAMTAAAVYFVIVVPANKLAARFSKPKAAQVDEQILLLREIRDSLRAGQNPADGSNG